VAASASSHERSSLVIVPGAGIGVGLQQVANHIHVTIAGHHEQRRLAQPIDIFEIDALASR